MVGRTAREIEGRFHTLEHTLRMLWCVSEQHCLRVNGRTGTRARDPGPSQGQGRCDEKGEPHESDVGEPYDDHMIRQQQMHVEKCGTWEKERWTVAARMFRDVRLIQVCFTQETLFQHTHQHNPVSPPYQHPL